MSDRKEHLTAKFQIGSINGRVNYTRNEKVFHSSDVPAKASDARAEVQSQLEIARREAEREMYVVPLPHPKSEPKARWNCSTDVYRPLYNARKRAAWDASATMGLKPRVAEGDPWKFNGRPTKSLVALIDESSKPCLTRQHKYATAEDRHMSNALQWERYKDSKGVRRVPEWDPRVTCFIPECIRRARADHQPPPAPRVLPAMPNRRSLLQLYRESVGKQRTKVREQRSGVEQNHGEMARLEREFLPLCRSAEELTEEMKPLIQVYTIDHLVETIEGMDKMNQLEDQRDRDRAAESRQQIIETAEKSVQEAVSLGVQTSKFQPAALARGFQRRQHPGVYQVIASTQEEGWSCCMASHPRSLGCTRL